MNENKKNCILNIIYEIIKEYDEIKNSKVCDISENLDIKKNFAVAKYTEVENILREI